MSRQSFQQYLQGSVKVRGTALKWAGTALSMVTSQFLSVLVGKSCPEKIHFAGESRDSATGGLYYIFARYMDPELGRFISLDPQLGSLSAPQSMNRYVYCVNNPLRYKDPTGQDFCSWLKELFFSEDYRYEPFDQEYHPGKPLMSWNPPWENKGWQASMAVVGIAFGAEVGLTYLAPEFLAGLPYVGRWFGPASTPIVNNADDIGSVVARGGIGGTVVRAGQDIPVNRVYGGASVLPGGSWTAENPLLMSPAGFRAAAGLPDWNTAGFMPTGYVPKGSTFVVKASSDFVSSTYGYLPGGLPEVVNSDLVVIILRTGIPIYG